MEDFELSPSDQDSEWISDWLSESESEKFLETDFEAVSDTEITRNSRQQSIKPINTKTKKKITKENAPKVKEMDNKFHGSTVPEELMETDVEGISGTKISRTSRWRNTKPSNTKVKRKITEGNEENVSKVKQIDNLFHCSLCKFTAQWKTVVTRHYNRDHMNFWGASEKRTWKCTKCDCCYTSELHLKRHMRAAHKCWIYKCKKCNFKSTNKKELESHQCSKKKFFQCSKCIFTADLRIKVIAHEKTHSSKSKENMSSKSKQEKVKTRLKRKKGEMSEKNKTINSKSIKSDILKTEETNRFKLNKNEADCDTDEKKPNSEVLVCDICFNYKTLVPKNLYFHKKGVHKVLGKLKFEPNYYKCESCSFDTVFFDDLKKHLIKVHKLKKVNKDELDRKGLKCNHCSRRFWCGNSFAFHKYTAHGDDTDLKKWNFKCTECNEYQNRSIKRLKAHISRSNCGKTSKKTINIRKYFKGTYIGMCKWEIGKPLTTDIVDTSDEEACEEQVPADNLDWPPLKGEVLTAEILQNSKTSKKQNRLNVSSVVNDDLDWLSSEENDLLNQDNSSIYSKDNEVITIEIVPDDDDVGTEFLDTTSTRASFNTFAGELILENSFKSVNKAKETIKCHEEDNQNKRVSVRFTCRKPNCGYQCFDLTNLQQHLKLHQERNEQTDENDEYECQKCGSSNLQRQMLQTHTNFHAKTDTDPSTEVSYLKYINKKLVGEMTLKVAATDDVYENLEEKDTSLFEVLEKLEEELADFNNGSHDWFQNKSRMFKCQICQHIINYKLGLRNHTNVHGRLAENLNLEVSYFEFNSNKCIKLIRMKPDLNCFTEKYMFECEECHFSLTRPFLEDHAFEHCELELDPNYKLSFSVLFLNKRVGSMELEDLSDFDVFIHTHQPMYRCSECRVPLTWKQSLLLHTNSHAKENSNLKEVIYFEFKKKVLLSKIRIKASESRKGDLKVDFSSDHSEFCCYDCDYTTTDKDAFKKHTSFHWIPEVKQTFKTKVKHPRSNRRREILDSNLNPDLPFLKCNECNYKSNNAESLKEHKNLHWNAEKEAAYKDLASDSRI